VYYKVYLSVGDRSTADILEPGVKKLLRAAG